MNNNQQEIDIYGFMCDCFDMVMRSRKINEDEIINKAKTVEPVLFVDENDGVYSLNIIFDDVCYTLGEVPVDLSEEDIDKESLKASFAAIVLFDKAFPDDESKNPVRRKNTFNIYHDMIKEKYGV